MCTAFERLVNSPVSDVWDALDLTVTEGLMSQALESGKLEEVDKRSRGLWFTNYGVLYPAHI